MEEIWKSIKSKLSEIAPKIIEELNIGATSEEISELEKLMGVKFPSDFVEFYKIHNGQGNSDDLLYCEEFLSLERIKDEWNIWKKLLDDKTFIEEDGTPFTSSPVESIKYDWWNAKWIPITYDGSGNHFCIDLDPTEKGNYGQIIRMWHDDPDRTLEATSFKEWITKYKDDLVNGELIYSEDYGGIIDKNEV